MYHILEPNRDVSLEVSFEDANPGHDLKWKFGRKMDTDDVPSDLRLTVDEVPEKYPDFFEEMPAPFCSQKMRDRLEACGVNNVEYYTVEVEESQTGTRIEGYFAMNVVGRIACLDRTRSRFTQWRNRVARIQSLALDERAAHDLHIFRLHEYQEVLVVSDLVANAVRDLTGIVISRAEGWSDEHRF